MSKPLYSRLRFGAFVFAFVALVFYAAGYAWSSQADPLLWSLGVKDACIGGGCCCALFFGVVSAVCYEPTPVEL